MTFWWSRYYRDAPEPLRSPPGTQRVITRERMRTVPRLILILKQVSSTVRGNKPLAQKTTMTWWQELQKRIGIAMTWWQEFRERETATLTWLQELQKRIGIAMSWSQEFRERESATMTWWQEPQNKTEIATTWLQYTKKLLTAPLAHFQESRKRTALPVNRNSAVKTPLRRSRQTKFC